MKLASSFLIIMTSMAIFSCKDNRIKYEKIITQTVRIRVHFLSENKSVFLKKNEIEPFKKVLVDKIRPDTVSSFIADTRIELIDDDSQQIGVITLIHNRGENANFNSEKLEFGFQLTYRIGMWVSELRYKN